MKLEDIYALAIRMGIKADPRGKAAVDRLLKKEQEKYDKLDEEKQAEYDAEKLINPYADTRMLNGDPATEVRSIIAGVDMETQEILLADRLREKGRSIDLVLAHHPEGRSLAALADVMDIHADVWHKAGVPINIGEAVIEGRQAEVMRSVRPLNHQRPVTAARLLELPFMCVHTPCDNLVTEFLQKRYDRMSETTTLDELCDDLKKIPEYAEAARENAGPVIFAGKGSRSAGRIVVDMTGGTGGPAESIERLAAAGVGTLIGMHISEKNREAADKHKLNVVIAGHDSSDSIGINLFLDELQKKGVGIIPCSGFIRVSRVKKPTRKPAKKTAKK